MGKHCSWPRLPFVCYSYTVYLFCSKCQRLEKLKQKPYSVSFSVHVWALHMTCIKWKYDGNRMLHSRCQSQAESLAAYMIPLFYSFSLVWGTDYRNYGGNLCLSSLGNLEMWSLHNYSLLVTKHVVIHSLWNPSLFSVQEFEGLDCFRLWIFRGGWQALIFTDTHVPFRICITVTTLF